MSRKRKKLPGWFIIPILVLIGFICFGASKLLEGNSGGKKLKVVEAGREDVKEIYNTSGIIESDKTKIFYSPVNAPIKTMKAKIGESVKKGDLLVTFDTENLERDNQTSKLNSLATRYTNQDTKEQSNRAAENMSKAKKQASANISDLKKQIKKKKEEIKKLKDQVSVQSKETAQSAKKLAELQKEMENNLNARSSYSADKENAERKLQNLDSNSQGNEEARAELVRIAENATNEITRLEQEYRSMEQKVKELEGADPSAAVQTLAGKEQELQALETSLTQMENSSTATADTSLTDAQLNNMKVSEDLAKLSELTTRELLEKGREGIKAEFDGVISDVKSAEGGEAVQGSELFTLVSNENVSVKLEVSAGDFDKLVVGNPVNITLGQYAYKGTLESVDKIALENEKGNPVIGAKVSIDNPDENICIGVSAKLIMTVAEKKNVLCLPNEVVNTASDGDFVYVIEGGILKKRNVKLGIISSTKVEIISGISEKDQVVADTSAELSEGMKAEAVEASETGKVSGE